MAVSNKKNCINNSDYSYSGREQNPLGLGFTPECEEVGKKMLGRDGKTYIVSVKNNKKIWMRVKEDDLSLSTDLVKDIPIIQETIATDDEYSTTDDEKDEKDEKDEEEVEEVEEKKEEKQEEKKKMTRKAPKEKANNFDIGFQKEGGDGNMYEIVENKNGVKRWMKVKEEKKNVKKEKKSMDGGDDNEKKEKKEKKKRAPSTYNLFIKQKMIEIRKNNDDIMPKECMKLATAEWKKLSDDEKDNFKKSLE